MVTYNTLIKRNKLLSQYTHHNAQGCQHNYNIGWVLMVKNKAMRCSPEFDWSDMKINYSINFMKKLVPSINILPVYI